MNSLEIALDKYTETFGENFPILCLMGVSDDDIILLIEKCIISGEKYEVSGDDDY